MTYRVQVVIPMDDNLPENFATNTLHFEVPTPGTQLAEIETALNAMYSNMSTFLSSLITPSLWQYKWFDLEEPPPRVPVRLTTAAGPTSTSTTSAPPEVALCISFKAAPVSGFPAGRLRNRIYIGPLGQNAMDTTGRPVSTLVTNLANSADGLLEASKSAGWDWVVYSPTSASAGQAPSNLIQSGWVDNEFDTQRRRGRSSTARTLFS